MIKQFSLFSWYYFQFIRLFFTSFYLQEHLNILLDWYHTYTYISKRLLKTCNSCGRKTIESIMYDILTTSKYQMHFDSIYFFILILFAKRQLRVEKRRRFRSHWEEALKVIKTEERNSGIWFRVRVTCPMHSH